MPGASDPDKAPVVRAVVSSDTAPKFEHRFPKLSLVDEKYANFQYPKYDTQITLEEFVEGYRLFAASQMNLYYTPEIIRRFVAGMAASKLLILEGISGTGKTSLPYSFSRYLETRQLSYLSSLLTVTGQRSLDILMSFPRNSMRQSS